MLASAGRWPDVPACYGWLTLDPRGQWRLGEGSGMGGGEIVRHPGLHAFLNANYAATPAGEWFVQNGPQRVFVELSRAPYIARLAATGTWETHNGLPMTSVSQALLDAEGHVYLVCEHGLAGVDDRDLATLLASAEADDAASGTMTVSIGKHRLALEAVEATTLPGRFGFILQPGTAAT